MPAKRTVAALAVVALVGCGPTVRSTLVQGERLPPRPAGHPIRTYETERPECPFREVGTVTVQRRSAFVEVEEMLELLRARAREMGGDAVLGLTRSDDLAGLVQTGNGPAAVRRPGIYGTVIVFRDPGCTR